MTDLTDGQRAEYFRRSYTAVDGLWFMKAEEKYGFEAALQMDEAVWRILPKIQARILKGMMNLENGREGVELAIATRLSLEGFDFEIKRQEKGFLVIVSGCPWHDLLVRSGRENLSERVGDLVCGVENSVWASEFGEMGFDREERICQGRERCVMRFGK